MACNLSCQLLGLCSPRRVRTCPLQSLVRLDGDQCQIPLFAPKLFETACTQADQQDAESPSALKTYVSKRGPKRRASIGQASPLSVSYQCCCSCFVHAFYNASVCPNHWQARLISSSGFACKEEKQPILADRFKQPDNFATKATVPCSSRDSFESQAK